jgi:hypothetical protein
VYTVYVELRVPHSTMSTGVDQLVLRQWNGSIKAEEVNLLIYSLEYIYLFMTLFMLVKDTAGHRNQCRIHHFSPVLPAF